MAVNAAGQFTGKWLFDAAIVTTQTIDGSDIMDAGLTGADLTDLLNQEFADAAALDGAAAALAQQYGAPPKPIQVALALPWLDPQETSFDRVWSNVQSEQRVGRGWTRPTGTCNRSSRGPRPRTGPS